MKDETGPSDSEKRSSSKIREFPKAKRTTPDEADPVPLMHVCVEHEGAKLLSLQWIVEMRYGGLFYICTGCGYTMPHAEVLECFEEE